MDMQAPAPRLDSLTSLPASELRLRVEPGAADVTKGRGRMF